MTLEIIPDSAARVQATRATRAAIRRSYTRYLHGDEPRQPVPRGYRAWLAAQDVPPQTVAHNVPERGADGLLHTAGRVYLPGYGWTTEGSVLAREYAAHAALAERMDRACAAATTTVPPWGMGTGRAEGSR